MRDLLNWKASLCVAAVIAGVAILTNPTPAHGEPDEKQQLEKTRPKADRSPKDIRSAINRMTRRDGRTIVYKAPDHNLIAEVKSGRIVRWSAIGVDGKSLPTRVVAKGVRCEVCIRTPNGAGVCYDIMCEDAPAPIPPKKSEVSARR